MNEKTVVRTAKEIKDAEISQYPELGRNVSMNMYKCPDCSYGWQSPKADPIDSCVKCNVKGIKK